MKGLCKKKLIQVWKDMKNVNFLGWAMVERCKNFHIKELHFSFSSPSLSVLCWGCVLIFLIYTSCDLVPCGTPSKNSFSLLQTSSFCFITARFIMAERRDRSTHSEGEMLGHTSSLSNEQVRFHWLPVFTLGQWEYWVYILHFTQGHMLFMNVCGSVSFYGCVTLILAAALL